MLPPQLADTLRPHLVTVPHSPHTTCNKYREPLLLGIPPLSRGVQSRPFGPLSSHLAPQFIILDKLSH
jgi:hypothetical protein